MKISEQLIAAKALIVNPANWIQGEYCDMENLESSTCFCSLGAIHKVLGNDLLTKDDNELSHTLALVIGGTYSGSVSQYNDSNGHAEVMQMWDKAIWLAKYHEQGEYE